MRLERLQLYRFRNYDKADLRLGKDLTVLFGANGTGKTNLLEAVYVALRQNSFRTSALGELAKHPFSPRQFSLRLHFTEPQGSQGKVARATHPKTAVPPAPSALRTPLSPGSLPPSSASSASSTSTDPLAQVNPVPSTFPTSPSQPILTPPVGSTMPPTQATPVTLTFSVHKHTRTLEHNGEKISIDTISKIFPRIILFTSEDGLLIQGSAAIRRTFLDRAISQQHPQYEKIAQLYQKTLSLRNRALKRHQSTGPWDRLLARYGSDLLRHRKAFLHALAGYAAMIFKELNPPTAGVFSLSYLPKNFIKAGTSTPPGELCVEEEDYLARLLQHRHYDTRRGYTVFGPHSDDLRIKLDDRLAKNYASQGESRTLAHALKLGVFLILKKHWSQSPILLLDDMFTELDGERLARLIAWIARQAQALLTCAQPELLRPHLEQLTKQNMAHPLVYTLRSPGEMVAAE